MANPGAFGEEAFTDRDFIPSKEDLNIIERQITDVEKELLGLRESIAQLERRHSKRANFLQKLRSASAPVRRLPQEILTEIFGWLLALHQEDGPEGDQIILPWEFDQRPWQFDLLHTCFRWREAALHSPFLWSNITIISPCGSEDDWTEKDTWIARLQDAQKLFPPNGPLTIGVDLGPSLYDFREACKLAVEHLYNPIMRQGRSISARFRGYSTQVLQMLHSKFEHPELLERLQVQDIGTGREEDLEIDLCEVSWDIASVLAQDASNLHRLDLIAGIFDACILEYELLEKVLPWKQLTHLVIHHTFPLFPRIHPTIIVAWLAIPSFCQNLTSLTLILRIRDDTDLEDWESAFDFDDNDDNIELDLPLLKNLFIDLDMTYFFKFIKLPSLSSLEIHNRKAQLLPDINTFINYSGCSMESFVEGAPDSQSSFQPGFIRPDLDKFFENLQGARTLKTYTLLDGETIDDIASGRFLPSVKSLQFYSDLSVETIVEILKPRLRNASQFVQSEGYSSLEELTINCLDSAFARSPFYVGETLIHIVHETSKLYRTPSHDYALEDSD